MVAVSVTTRKMLRAGKTVTGEMIRLLRERDLKQSQAEFGKTLKRAIDPRAEYPYTRQYIFRLEKGLNAVTDEIAGAFWAIAGAYDDQPAGVSGTEAVTVYALPGQIPEGVYIPLGAKVVRCKRPGCPVVFLRTNNFQEYHHNDCREAHAEQVLKDRIRAIMTRNFAVTEAEIAAILHVRRQRITEILWKI